MKTITWPVALCLAFKAFFLVLRRAPGVQVHVGADITYTIHTVPYTNKWWDCHL